MTHHSCLWTRVTVLNSIWCWELRTALVPSAHPALSQQCQAAAVAQQGSLHPRMCSGAALQLPAQLLPLRETCCCQGPAACPDIRARWVCTSQQKEAEMASEHSWPNLFYQSGDPAVTHLGPSKAALCRGRCCSTHPLL